MATYTKLRSGEWGVRVEGTARQGQTVTVTTKAGATKSETIAKVIWTGNGTSICAIEQRGGRGQPLSRLDDYSLAERGLVRVSGPRGEYVRRASRQEIEDELGY